MPGWPGHSWYAVLGATRWSASRSRGCRACRSQRAAVRRSCSAALPAPGRALRARQGHKREPRGHRGMQSVSWRSSSDDFTLFSLLEFEGELKIAGFVARERHRIDAGVAGRAVGRARTVDGAEQTAEAQVLHAVGLDEVANFIERVRRGNELAAARRIDAVEGWRDRRRATDPHVHLARAGGPDHAD